MIMLLNIINKGKIMKMNILFFAAILVNGWLYAQAPQGICHHMVNLAAMSTVLLVPILQS